MRFGFPSNGDGVGYLNIGGDRDRGSAVSEPFVLPKGANGVGFLRCGGANAPSGVSVKNADTAEVLCTSTIGTNTNNFFAAVCSFGGDSMAGQTVQIEIQDVQRSGWGKVFVDNFRIRLSSGDVVPIPAPAGNDTLRLC